MSCRIAWCFVKRFVKLQQVNYPIFGDLDKLISQENYEAQVIPNQVILR